MFEKLKKFIDSRQKPRPSVKEAEKIEAVKRELRRREQIYSTNFLYYIKDYGVVLKENKEECYIETYLVNESKSIIVKFRLYTRAYPPTPMDHATDPKYLTEKFYYSMLYYKFLEDNVSWSESRAKLYGSCEYRDEKNTSEHAIYDYTKDLPISLCIREGEPLNEGDCNIRFRVVRKDELDWAKEVGQFDKTYGESILSGIIKLTRDIPLKPLKVNEKLIIDWITGNDPSEFRLSNLYDNLKSLEKGGILFDSDFYGERGSEVLNFFSGNGDKLFTLTSEYFGFGHLPLLEYSWEDEKPMKIEDEDVLFMLSDLPSTCCQVFTTLDEFILAYSSGRLNCEFLDNLIHYLDVHMTRAQFYGYYLKVKNKIKES